MSEKISKISVDGVVYDIASTGGGEVPGDIQEQLSALENKVTEEASAREEGDAKLQAAIDELAEKVNGEGADLTELEGKIEKNAADIATVNNNLVEAVNNINKNVADGFSTINGGLNNEIRPELEKAVKYEDTATEQNPGRKTIFLNNHDNICGKTTDGSAVNIAMVSKWNKVDLGSSSVEINLNGSAERPTYNGSKGIALSEDLETKAAELQDNIKASQSNLEAYMSATDTKVSELEEKIGNVPTKVSELENDLGFQNEAQVDGKIKEAIDAIPPVDLTPYVSDVAGLSNTLEALNATVQILQSKVDVLTKTNTEVVSVDGSAGELKDSSKDYIVSGSINENAEIVGKSISLKSIKVSDNARLKLNAGDVEAKDLNISGSFPKANGNTVISVNNAEFIVFKDMVFDASEVYNGIEIGLASNSVLPKNILFDNCKFQGEFSNNAILVFGTQDNAIITLNNCYFEKISNALRLSNKSNASGVVVNINNCTVDQWETRAPWQGFLICEDYTNKTEEEVNANNLFGDGKITVNFNNLVHAGVKINPADPASVCGTKNESQVVMVCQDAVAGPEGDYCLSYDAAKFPVVSFK
jgi:peptidoglycan hydrolase CwlO-like protein